MSDDLTPAITTARLKGLAKIAQARADAADRLARSAGVADRLREQQEAAEQAEYAAALRAAADRIDACLGVVGDLEEREQELLDTLAERETLLSRLANAFGCKAGRDGECFWPECPQGRDGEPARSGRHCPRDIACGDPHCDATERANRALAAEIEAALKTETDDAGPDLG